MINQCTHKSLGLFQLPSVNIHNNIQGGPKTCLFTFVHIFANYFPIFKQRVAGYIIITLLQIVCSVCQ